MASDWYPTIDTGRCKENCFACVAFCPQHVYERQDKKPAVTKPEACIKGCDSCKEVCPVNAISFLSTKIIEIDGLQIGVAGLDEAIQNNKQDFDKAFEEICSKNYIPDDAKGKFREAIKKEFDRR